MLGCIIQQMDLLDETTVHSADIRRRTLRSTKLYDQEQIYLRDPFS